MMMLKEIKQNISSALAGYPVSFAYLYGSAALEKATPLSDIDIALVVETSVNSPDFLNLELEVENELEKSLPSRRFDVRIINEAPLRFKAQVVQKGKLIFSQNESRRVEFETYVRDRYFDFIPKIEESRTAFLKRLSGKGLYG